MLSVSGCRSPQAKEAGYLRKGKEAFGVRNYQVAIIQFKNAIAAQPKDAEPYYQLGLTYLAISDFTSAVTFFRRASELNPKHAEAQLKLSELMVASRSADMLLEAQKRTRGVLDLQPDNIEALNLLALTELELGKPESAEALLQQALRKAPGSLQSSVALAHSRLWRGDAPGAEEALKQAVAQAPKAPVPVVYLGGFYLSTGRSAEAEQQFRRALDLDPKYGPALIALGAMQVRAGQAAEAEQTYRRLSALPDKAYRPLHALYLFQSGKRDEAVAEMEKLAKQDPEDRDARTRLVRGYLALNRIGDAERVLTAALKRNRLDTDALLQRSRIYLGSAKYAEAESDLNQVLRFRNDAEAHYLLSKLHQARGHNELRPQELGEALRVDPRFAAARLELAQVLTTTGGAQSALKLLDEAPEDQRRTAPVVVQRNWALLTLGQKDEARKGVDQALALGRIPDAILQDAVLKFGQKDYSAVRGSVEEVLKYSPEDVRALNLLFQSYAAPKQAPAGVQKVREYAARLSASAPVQQFLGQILAANGDRVGARKAFESARAANPALVTADIALAELDAYEGKAEDAKRELSAVVASHPENLPGRLFLAQLESSAGNPAAAIGHYRKALELDGKNAATLNNLAYLLAENNQADEALKYAQLAKELAPDSAPVDDTLGWTYYRKGLYTMAVTHIESAVAKEATARRRYHLAMAYFKAGDPKRGRLALEAATKTDPALPEAAVARQLLGNAGK
ncbi:MAG: tetratricopeptide repeat protein [Acidobacteriia bacterium]|nr:tetratricopeptide repeat protein [Terriglobia bacterium]